MKLSLRKPININAISSFFHESFVRLFKSSPPSPSPPPRETTNFFPRRTGGKNFHQIEIDRGPTLRKNLMGGGAGRE